MDQNIKQQIVETLNGTTNVLITVSSNPSIDELAACIGLTLVLNKLDKHATAVFSGKVPSTLEFLKPDETLEKNTDSLRDFIISLDKTKADKLRYKVEDSVVKIFITPYKTSISQKDFEFSQGDFNVDVVLALGVHKREELDQAIMAHGRILHDATVICVNNEQVSNLGVYNWQDAEASSLCEMVVDLAETIKPDNFDGQMATALLTGIVAETERFSNEKTSPRTMSLSAKLMAAGANQQLVASKLQTQLKQEDLIKDGNEPETDKVDGDTLTIAHNPDEDEEKEPEESKTDKTELEVEHEDKDEEEPFTEESIEQPQRPDHEKRVEPDESSEDTSDEVIEDENRPKIGSVKSEPTESRSALSDTPKPSSDEKPANSRIAYEPPTMGGTLTANARPEGLEPSTDAMSLPTPVGAQMLSHDTPKTNNTDTNKPLMDEDTLSHIEKSVGSDHTEQPTESTPAPDLNALQQAVEEAANADDNKDRLEPLVASGASPLDMNVQSNNVPASDMLTPVNPGPPPLETPVAEPPVAPLPAAPMPTPAPAAPQPAPSLPPAPTAAPGPSASELMASLSQTGADQRVSPMNPATPPAPMTPPTNPSLPTQLVPPDPGLPPEQTASGTPNPLAPPPVPPPFTGGFPPMQPPAPGGQPPLPPVPPAPGV